MRHRKALVLTALALLGPAVPGHGQATPMPAIDLPPELSRVLRDYEDQWRARNAEGLAGLFTEDGFVMSPNSPPVRGRDRIAVRYQGAGGPLHLRAFAYETNGDVGYIIGGYGSTEERMSGKFVLALKRGPDGRWMIAADMDNGNG